MPINKDSFWKKFDEFNFYYRVKNGILKQAPISKDGSVLIDEKYTVTNIPTSFIELNFIDKINQEFGTNFGYNEFDKSCSKL